MDGLPVIIIDEDGTNVLDSKRAYEALKRCGNKNVKPEDIYRKHNVSRFFEGFGYDEFLEHYLNSELFSFDEPLPHAADVQKGLIERGFGTVYISGRPHDIDIGDSLLEVTRQFHRTHGFPYPSMKYPTAFFALKPSRKLPDKAFRIDTIKKIAVYHPIIAAIGDKPEDAEAYLEAGINGDNIFIITTYTDIDYRRFLRGIKLVDSWDEIGKYLGRVKGRPDILKKCREEEERMAVSFQEMLDDIAKQNVDEIEDIVRERVAEQLNCQFVSVFHLEGDRLTAKVENKQTITVGLYEKSRSTSRCARTGIGGVNNQCQYDPYRAKSRATTEKDTGLVVHTKMEAALVGPHGVIGVLSAINACNENHEIIVPKEGEFDPIYATPACGFTAAHLRHLVRAGVLVGAKIEAAMAAEYGRDYRLAATLQENFTSRKAPDFHGYRISFRFEPCMSIGGDYLYFFELDKNRLGIAVGDTSGHGMSGMLVTSRIASALRYELEDPKGPKRKGPVSVMNKIARYANSAIPEDFFMTMIFGVLDGNKFEYVNAGHPPIFVIRKDGIEFFEKGVRPLGVLERIYNPSDKIILNSGDKMILYTDGVTEATSPDGTHFKGGFMEILKRLYPLSAEEAAKAIFDGMYEHLGGEKNRDDAAIVVVEKL